MNHHDTQTELRNLLSRRHDVPLEQVRMVWAPYRICPLGAHIDHQLGTVTAMAIDRGVHLAYAPSGCAEVRLHSLAYPGEVRFAVNAVPLRAPGDWGNYARGAAFALSQSNALTQGIVGVTSGDLAEVGLSSSASIGLAYLMALEEVNGLRCTSADNIRLDQAIENQYLGLNNGILDQTAILLSRRDHLTVIDCRVFAEELSDNAAVDALPGIRSLPKNPALPPFAILVAYSGLTKAIVSTDYNRRVAECREAAQILLQAASRPQTIARLGLLSHEDYEAHRARLSGALARRAEHFFSEMTRVQRGIEAWQRGDLAALGNLMQESGESSIRNYECGSPPLIDLHEVLNRTAGVYGARFSGAGFRGCCVALADPPVAAQAGDEILAAYAVRRPELAPHARLFVCEPADGARIL